MYGREKWVGEPNRLRRWAYRLFGEVNVPGRLRAYHILRTIRALNLAARPVRLLEAGFGKGDLAFYLARKHPAWHIVGIDIEPAKVERASRVAQHLGLSNVEFRTGRLEAACFQEGFDLIVNADVLEHIEDDRTVIRNFCRSLRPGGHVIITSPSIPQRRHLSLVRWREKRIGFHPSQYGHVRDGYSEADLREKFSAAGGRLLSARQTFGFFGTLAFDLFFCLGDNRPNPVAYALMLPVLMALAALDLMFPSATGSAILAVGSRLEHESGVAA